MQQKWNSTRNQQLKSDSADVISSTSNQNLKELILIGMCSQVELITESDKWLYLQTHMDWLLLVHFYQHFPNQGEPDELW